MWCLLDELLTHTELLDELMTHTGSHSRQHHCCGILLTCLTNLCQRKLHQPHGQFPNTPLPACHSYIDAGPFDSAQNLSTDAAGWPTSLPPATIAHKLALRNVLLRAPPGRYVALYDGHGSVDFGMDAKVGTADQ